MEDQDKLSELKALERARLGTPKTPKDVSEKYPDLNKELDEAAKWGMENPEKLRELYEVGDEESLLGKATEFADMDPFDPAVLKLDELAKMTGRRFDPKVVKEWTKNKWMAGVLRQKIMQNLGAKFGPAGEGPYQGGIVNPPMKRDKEGRVKYATRDSYNGGPLYSFDPPDYRDSGIEETRADTSQGLGPAVASPIAKMKLASKLGGISKRELPSGDIQVKSPSGNIEWTPASVKGDQAEASNFLQDTLNTGAPAVGEQDSAIGSKPRMSRLKRKLLR